MTPEHDEADRLLRLARQDQIAFEILTGDARASFATAAFHGQQAVEKGLKAVLCLQGMNFLQTHDLDWLGGQIEASGLALPISSEALRRLTPYAVTFRYDDDPVALATPDDVREWVVAVLDWAGVQLAGNAKAE